jgi:phospholipid/cholesterol/gamma-HCH transport system permease protein
MLSEVLMTAVLRGIDHLGRLLTKNIEYTCEVLLMVYLAFRAAIFEQSQGLRTIFSVVSAQIYFSGWQALPLVSVLALVTGAIVVLQSSSQLSFLGGSDMIGNLLVVIIVRELGPLLTALVVIARSGTAVASEIGNMRANREIEALEVMGINPLSFIVFPRLLGGIISVLCLAIYYILIAILGGFFVTRLIQNMSLSFYLDSLASAVAAEDLWLFLLKNAFSGMIIFVVACYQGLSVMKSHTEVPIATTQAVVKSIGYVVVFNLTVTTLFYLSRLKSLGLL